MRKIKMRLDSASIGDAISELKEYQSKLDDNAEKIREEIAEILTEMVKQGFNGPIYDDVLYGGMRSVKVDVRAVNEDSYSAVIAKGGEIVWIEFGAGVYHNGPAGSIPHPNPPSWVVGIGEYGKGQGKRRVWVYRDESGELHLTHGTPASMPMYKAAQEVKSKIPDIASNVLNGGD